MDQDLDKTKQAPGEARCPGPSTAEIIAKDPGGAPPTFLEESYSFIGDEDISFDHYTSNKYFNEEMDKMWSNTWQWACRLEHIPAIGDYYVYDIGNLSVLIVNTKEGIKGFYNSCLHRGTQLKPCASVGRSNDLKCPYHGWTWSLEGKLLEVPCDWDFPHLNWEKSKLPEVNIETWGGFIFVNLSKKPESLLNYLGVLPNHFKKWPLEDRYVALHVRKVLPANWKDCIEAFLEAYHVLETHSQAINYAGDANAQYDVFSDHVTRFIHTLGYKSPHVKEELTQQQILDSALGIKDSEESEESKLKVPDGKTAREMFAANTKKNLEEAYKMDFSEATITETIDSIEYHLFPNACFFPGLSLPMVYRFRPNGSDVDSTIFDLLFMEPIPEGKTCPPPAQPYDLRIEDSYCSVPGINVGLGGVYDQDTVNLESQQRGFKTSKKGAQTLGNYQEVRIRHFHQMINNYIGKNS